MTSIQHPRSKYTVILCLIVIGIGVPLLFIPWDNTYHPRSLKLIWNFGHVPLFAAMAALLMQYPAWFVNRTYELRIAILIVVALITGVVIEAIQFGAGRQFSLQDIYYDVIGACLVPAATYSSAGVLTPYSRPVLRLIVGVCLFAALSPLAASLLDEHRARRQFPVLAAFTSRLELGRFGGGSRLQLTNHGLQVTFGTEKYSGFSLNYFPVDWMGYSYLTIEILHPGSDNVYLTCRIHDRLHDQAYDDRYNRRFTVRPGPNVININLDDVASAPRNRMMDMERIAGLGCFTVRLPAPAVLVIRTIALG
jgi:VanZ family protein